MRALILIVLLLAFYLLPQSKQDTLSVDRRNREDERERNAEFFREEYRKNQAIVDEMRKNKE